jgi:glycosyltransferase involved in cell wall biosynthesis
LNALFLHRSLEYHGGVSQSFLHIAEFRDPRILRMHVSSFHAPSREIVDRLSDFAVPVCELGDNYLLSAHTLFKLVTKLHIDVIVCTSFKAFVVASAAATTRRCRVVFWIPSIPIMMDLVRRTMFRLLARKRRLIFISKAVAEAHEYPWHAEASSVLYYGVPDHPHAAAPNVSLRKLIGANSNDVLIGYVAEMTGWKNHATLLYAFELMADRVPHSRLVLFGTGELFSYLENIARTLRASDRIHFLGPRPDVRDLLPALDVYVHPSIGEGFGIAVAEAMLARVPVAAARAGALPEFVIDGKTGLLFDPTDPADIAQTIESFLQNDALRSQLSDAGRAYCLEHFDPKRFADRMTKALLEEVLSS